MCAHLAMKQRKLYRKRKETAVGNNGQNQRQQNNGTGWGTHAAIGSSEPRSKRLRMVNEEQQKRLFIILEDFGLEVGKVGNEYVILCGDKHANWLRLNGKDPAKYNPNILHQALLMLQDSPLNRAGLLRVFFRTKGNVLVEVHPQCQVPATFDRFCLLMVQLLHKLNVRAEGNSQKLLSIIKNPITGHLPVGCKKYLIDAGASKMVKNMTELIPSTADEPIALVIRDNSHEKISIDYTEGEIKISNYPLSPALCCAKLTTSFEELWDVI